MDTLLYSINKNAYARIAQIGFGPKKSNKPKEIKLKMYPPTFSKTYTTDTVVCDTEILADCVTKICDAIIESKQFENNTSAIIKHTISQEEIRSITAEHDKSFLYTQNAKKVCEHLRDIEINKTYDPENKSLLNPKNYKELETMCSKNQDNIATTKKNIEYARKYSDNKKLEQNESMLPQYESVQKECNKYMNSLDEQFTCDDVCEGTTKQKQKEQEDKTKGDKNEKKINGIITKILEELNDDNIVYFTSINLLGGNEHIKRELDGLICYYYGGKLFPIIIIEIKSSNSAIYEDVGKIINIFDCFKSKETKPITINTGKSGQPIIPAALAYIDSTYLKDCKIVYCIGEHGTTIPELKNSFAIKTLILGQFTQLMKELYPPTIDTDTKNINTNNICVKSRDLLLEKYDNIVDIVNPSIKAYVDNLQKIALAVSWINPDAAVDEPQNTSQHDIPDVADVDEPQTTSQTNISDLEQRQQTQLKKLDELTEEIKKLTEQINQKRKIRM